MPHYPLDEYLERVRRFNPERSGSGNMGRHGRGGSHHSYGSYGTSYNRDWGVYLVEGVYYVSTWTDLPYSHVAAIEKFQATDRRDALIKGYKIAEKHAEQNEKLPADQRVKTVVSSNSDYDGYNMYGY